ncbi:17454_t:CDS:1, partial [Rhizophagus irregularis]
VLLATFTNQERIEEEITNSIKQGGLGKVWTVHTYPNIKRFELNTNRASSINVLDQQLQD